MQNDPDHRADPPIATADMTSVPVPLPVPGPEAGLGHGPLKLLIADHAATRMGIKLALGTEASVCAEVSDAQEGIRAAKREQPDVALVGAEVSGDWRAAVRGICRAAPGCAIVVLAQQGDVDDMLEAVRAGALGYVPGTLDADRLQRIFRAVSEREAIVPRAMVIELLSELRGADAGQLLTGREAQVLGMLRRGHTTARIAERLQIAPVTVRRHISELVHKFGVANRSDLIAWSGNSAWGRRPQDPSVADTEAPPKAQAS